MGIVQKNSLWITVFSYFGAALGYFNKIYLFTNFLTTEQIGLLAVMVSVAIIYAQLSGLGSSNIILRFFPFFHNKENKHNGIQGATLGIALLGFTILTAFFVGFSDTIQEYYNQRAPLLSDYYSYIILLALSFLLSTYVNSYLRSLNRTIASSVVVEVVLRLAITFGVLLYALGWVSFETFVWLYLLSYTVPAVILFGYLAYIGELSLKISDFRLLKRFRKQIAVYGGFSILSGISAVLVTNIDTIMVLDMLSLSQAGIYSTTVAICVILLMPYRAIIKVSSPIVATYWRHRDMDAMRNIYQKASLNNLIISGFIFILLWANIDNLYYFMPEEFATGKLAFLFLGIGRLFDCVCGLNGIILMTSKKYRFDMYFSLLLILLTFASNRLFIPQMGIAGAALATMITLIFYNTIRVVFLYRSYKLFPFTLNLLKVLGLFIIALIINHALPFMSNVWIDGFVRSSLLGLAFIGTVFLGKFSPEFNEIILNFLPKFKR